MGGRELTLVGMALKNVKTHEGAVTFSGLALGMLLFAGKTELWNVHARHAHLCTYTLGQVCTNRSPTSQKGH